MNILKETQYLQFIEFEKKEKTRVIAVKNKHHEEVIGVIKWFSRWRQYCFFPVNDTVWNINCLNDVNSVITMLADERKKPVIKPVLIKNVGVIAESINDFQNWKKKNEHEAKFGDKNTLRIYECNNVKYICVSRPEHSCSWSFDEVVETENAKKNPEYQIIWECIKPTLVSTVQGMEASKLSEKIFPSESDFYFKD